MSSEKINSVQKNGDTAPRFDVTLFISVVPTKPTDAVFNGIALAQASLTTNDEAVCIMRSAAHLKTGPD
jgi:hypothetical protein